MQYMTSLYDITHCMLAYSDVISCVTCFSAGLDNAPDPACVCVEVDMYAQFGGIRYTVHR